MQRLTTEQLLAEQARYREILTKTTNPEERRVAEMRLGQIEAELAQRNGREIKPRRNNRWPHVPLVDLFREFGATLHEKSNNKFVGNHPWRHSSRSGTCLVVWPHDGWWHCSSCKAGGDAAALVADYFGISYREACHWLEERFGPAPTSYESLPWIDASIQDLRVITSKAWEALKQFNDPAPSLFRFGGTLVRLERDDDGRLVPVELTTDRMRHLLARCANFYRTIAVTGLERRIIVRPPQYVVADLLATPDPPLPVLRRIVEVPVFAVDGSLRCVPGYHSDARLFYDPAPGLVIPPVPERPTDDDVMHARSLLLDDLFADFPFVSEADRAHAVALFLLPFVRDLIDGPTPLHLVEAPTEGSGKGLLVETSLLPGVGDRIGVMAPGRDADEWRKAITSALRAGHQAIWVDNVTRPLDSAELAAALTASTWEDRLLGRSEMLRLPVRSIWVATANNPVLSREVARRTIRIRIDPKVDMPWLRTEFKHHPLKAWVRQHRGELIRAALVLVQNWLARGRPAPTVRPLGSFESWTTVLGGILESAQIPGFLGNLDDFYQTVVTDVARWRAFVEGWWARYGSEPVLARDLVSLALDAELDIRGRDEAAQARSLGKHLERMRDRIVGEFRIESAGSYQRALRWRLRRLPPDASPPSQHHTLGSAETTGFPADAIPPDAPRAFCEFCEFCEFSVPEPKCASPAILERVGETHKTHKTHTAHRPGTATDEGPGVEHAAHTKTTVSVRAGSRLAAWQLVEDATTLQHALPDLLAAPIVGLDCETTGLDPYTDRLRLIQLATPNKAVFLIDCFAVDPRVLQPLFAATQTPVLVGHNLAFDLAFLQQAGLRLPPRRWIFDTGLAAQLLDATPHMPSLAELVNRLLGVTLDKTHQQADWGRVLSPTLLEYAALDAAVLVPLYDHLTSALKQAELERVAAIEFRALPAVVWLRLSGAPFDADAWRTVSDSAAADMLRLADELTHTAAELLGATILSGWAMNWESAPQVLALLRETGLELSDTREETLAYYRDHPLVAKLLAYREAAKRSRAYGLDWLRFIHPLTGRIHADWRQIGAASGRMACSTPNLQNIPRDPCYRACFRPSAGRVLVKADYSQIELRIAAEISGDQRLTEIFARGEDVHARTASLVLGKPLEAVTKDDRQLAKAINFGLLYGMGVNAFAEYAQAAYGVVLSKEDAATLRERFFTAYPGLRRWHRSQPDGTVEVRTLAGRRRVVERFTEKLNTPVQGTGADGLKLALALLWETQERCPGAVPVLAVHDELVVECDRDRAEDVRAWVVECMTQGMQTFLRQVPVEVEVMVCRDWSGTPVDEEQR